MTPDTNTTAQPTTALVLEHHPETNDLFIARIILNGRQIASYKTNHVILTLEEGKVGACFRCNGELAGMASDLDNVNYSAVEDCIRKHVRYPRYDVVTVATGVVY